MADTKDFGPSKVSAHTTQRCVAWLLCFATLLARGRPRLAHAHLWAEDGIIFLHDVLEQGAASVLAPYAGYFHTLPRLVALVCGYAPLSCYAFLTTLVCFVVYAFVLSEFSARAYAWLVDGYVWRLCACLLMCMAGGLHETLGNLTNLHTGCFIYLCLLAMRHIEARFTKAEIAFVGLCALTEGSAFLLLPSFIVRVALLRRARKTAAHQVAADNAVVGGVVATSLVASYIASFEDPIVSADFSMDAMRRALLDTPWLLLDRFVMSPIFGAKIDACIQHTMPHLFYFLATPLLAVLLYRLSRGLGRHAILVVLPCVSILVHYLLMWSVRPGAQELFHMLEVVAPMRHTFASAALSVVFVCAALAAVPQTKKAFLGLYLWFACTLAAQDFNVDFMTDGRRDWPQAAATLERARASAQPVEVWVPIMPRQFSLLYRNNAARAEHK